MSYRDSIFGPPTPPPQWFPPPPPPPPPSYGLLPTPPSYGLQSTPAPSLYCDFTTRGTFQGPNNPGFGYGNEERIGQNYENFGQGIEKNDVFDRYQLEIQRHLEKGRIRDEIIAAELAWRRVLESEVREELRMERELALRMRELNAFDNYRVPVGKPFLQETRELSLEERIAMCIDERLRMRGGFGTAGVDPLPFQRTTVENPKEKCIFLAKPSANPSGTAKQVVSPANESANLAVPGVGFTLEKKVCVCKICQICTTSEKGLYEHFQGKKHKLKVEADQKCFNIGICDLSKETSQHVPKPIEEPKIYQSKPIEEKKSLTYWCEMCGVGADLEKLMEQHLNGKRHLKMLQNCSNLPKFEEFWCEMCGVRADHEKLKEQHLNGKKHLNKLKMAAQTQSVTVQKSAEKSTNEEIKKENQSITFWCEMCGVRANQENLKEQHLNGKRHLSKLKLIQTQSVSVQKSAEKITNEEICCQNSREKGSMDIMSALQLVLKKSSARGGLARGLHEGARAIGKDAAQLCVLAEDCDQPDHVKHIKALCADHDVGLISIPSRQTLGEWAGLYEGGNARNVVSCACVVVKDFGEESEGLHIVQEYMKSC